jgi:hypothetical protein
MPVNHYDDDGNRRYESYSHPNNREAVRIDPTITSLKIQYANKMLDKHDERVTWALLHGTTKSEVYKDAHGSMSLEEFKQKYPS